MGIKRVSLFFTVLLISALLFSMFGSGCSLTAEEPVSDLPPEFDIIAEIWDALSKDYVDKDKLDPEKLSQGAARGMMEALDDPYSAYIDPEMHELELRSLKGKYQGIGAYVGIRDKQLTIIAPIAGSPAEEANLKPGDKILEINGKNTAGMSLTEAALTIQGPKGTSVSLLILHSDDDEPVEIEIIRSEIKLESVHWEMIDNIAYIRLTSFLKNTGVELSSSLEDIISEGVDGIVLDFRNNPGGLLNVAVDVASQFLDDGIVVDVVDNEGNRSSLPVKSGGVAVDLPLIVLVNAGSASGSEVVAGALQDYGRAKLAGTQTYGKGSVQLIRKLDDGSALHITTALWFTPMGRPIAGVGLEPDFLLELEGEELVDWAVDYLKTQVGVNFPSSEFLEANIKLPVVSFLQG